MATNGVRGGDRFGGRLGEVNEWKGVVFNSINIRNARLFQSIDIIIAPPESSSPQENTYNFIAFIAGF